LGDLIGLDVWSSIMELLYNETNDSKYRAHPLLEICTAGCWKKDKKRIPYLFKIDLLNNGVK
jgi:3-hydroxyacyl-CoA dehydrogenase